MIQNAKIKSTQLKLEQDGTFSLTLELALPDKVSYATHRVMLDFRLIKEILISLELPSYEEISRKLCRVKLNDSNNRVVAIGHYLLENWVEV